MDKQVRVKAKPKFFIGFNGAFLALFFLVYLAVFIQIVFFNSAFGYSPLLQIVLLLFWFAFLAVATGFVLRKQTFLLQHKTKLLWMVILFIFLVQLYVGVVTKQQLDHDYGKLYNGAVIFATEGANSPNFTGYSQYFHHFTNNAGLFLFLQALFRIMHLLGLTCFYEVFIVIGHLCFCGAIFFTFKYLNKAFGAGAALASLLFYLFFLPVYFQSSIAYTDTYTIWIPPLVLYLAKSAQTTKRKSTSALLFVAIGCILALGNEIKTTVLITGIALVFQTILHRESWKQKVAVLLAAVIAFLGVSALAYRYTYTVLLSEERVQQEAWPITYWLMMGLEGDGSYNHTDEWVITAQAPTLQTRSTLCTEHIKGRLQAMGPAGYLQLLHRKTCRTFGSGNADVCYLLVRQPDNPNHWVYQIVSTNGRLYRYFDNFSQAVYLSFYLFALAGVAYALKNRSKHYFQNIAPFLSLVGFFFFMMLWESNHRLLVNQWPLFIIAAAAGFAEVVKSKKVTALFQRFIHTK